MPVYTWDEMKTFPITPGKSMATGQSIVGQKIIVQHNTYHDKRDDGTTGAKLHAHDEEMFIIMISGEMRCREGENSEWKVIKAGDVFYTPSHLLHEVSADADVVCYFVKNRINGHSIYDMGWQPGAEDAWKEICKLYNESETFENHDPWYNQ